MSKAQNGNKKRNPILFYAFGLLVFLTCLISMLNFLFGG